MKVGEETFDSWSEFALQDLLIDVAAVVDATDSDRVWNGDVLSGLNVASQEISARTADEVNSGKNLRKPSYKK